MGQHKHFCSLGMSIKCLTIVQTRSFHAFWEFFFYILVEGIYVTKTVKKCLQFVYFCSLIACEMSDKIFNSGS
jgi:hypothetical protein